MIDFEFIINKNLEKHTHPTIEVLFVLDGLVNFHMGIETYTLHQNDFIVINSDKIHSYCCKADVLLASLHIPIKKLKKLLKQDNLFFWCNSAIEDDESYNEIRKILKKICNIHFCNKNQNELNLYSLYYEFLNVLTSNFLLIETDKRYSEIAHKNEERKHEISEYIQTNYDKQIRLNDLANKLFLSRSYLSKYIKKQFNMSFVDYVNEVRLNHAIYELIYSDKPVVRIAMDTGFASSAAFNKVFKEKYHTTPSAYRVQWKGHEKKSIYSIEKQKKLEEKLAAYYDDHREEIESDNSIKRVITLDNTKGEELEKHWCKMINVGAAADLLDSKMQEHILKLKKELDIQYVRFWDIYSPEMFLNEHFVDKQYNFSKLDRVLDFLVTNGLTPYIEIGVKPKKLIKSFIKPLLEQDVSDIFGNEKVLQHFFQSFIKHLINRYRFEEVEKWYFEYWRVEQKFDYNRKFCSIKVDIKAIEHYLNNFDIIASTLRCYLPSVKIGGSGLSISFGQDNFIKTLEQWSMHEQQPDFLSLYCYPYVPEEGQNEISNKAIDSEFLKNYIDSLKQLVSTTDFSGKELHISEWNFTVSNRNILNDSCVKGAYLMKNTIDSYGMVDILGYWIGSDLFADFYDSRAFLNGSSGLLTKDGIAKPSYYAFSFMNRLGKKVLKKGENYVITDNGRGNYRIACNNYKNFNYQYCLCQEDEINIREVSSLLTDSKKLYLNFNLPVIKNGRYQIKIYSVNHNYGSVQDEWCRMGRPEETTQEDINYLSRICIPRMIINHLEVSDNRVLFETVLESNEIQFIHLTYQY